jgi:hypothetical protein
VRLHRLDEHFIIALYMDEKRGISRVEFLGKGYQLKWPLGTYWEL